MKRHAKISTRAVVTVGVVVALAAGVAAGVMLLSRTKVQVTRLVTADVVQAFYATGTVVAEREYEVRSQVAGVVELKAGIDKGSVVKKGQVLGRVVSEDLEKKVRQAEAEVKEKRARADEKTSPVLGEYDKRVEAFEEILASAKREYQRLLTLAETGSAQRVEIDRAADRVKTTWAELEGFKAQKRVKALETARELEVAEAGLEIAKWGIEQQELRAPVDGVVLDWPVPTRTRTKIDEHMMLIADVRPESLIMRAQVDEEDRDKLHVGQVVRMTLYAFGEGKFEGRVKTIYAKADAQRRTFEVDVDQIKEVRGATNEDAGATTQATTVQVGMPASGTTNPTTAPITGGSAAGRFAPGLTGELAFIEKEKKGAMILPRQALQGDSFWVVRGGKLARVPAQAGVKAIDRVEVLGGIAKEDEVVISAIGKLAEGEAVRTEFVENRVAADGNRPKETEVFKGGF